MSQVGDRRDLIVDGFRFEQQLWNFKALRAERYILSIGKNVIYWKRFCWIIGNEAIILLQMSQCGVRRQMNSSLGQSAFQSLFQISSRQWRSLFARLCS